MRYTVATYRVIGRKISRRIRSWDCYAAVDCQFQDLFDSHGTKAIKLARAMERASTNNVRMVMLSAFDLFAVKQAAPL